MKERPLVAIPLLKNSSWLKRWMSFFDKSHKFSIERNFPDGLQAFKLGANVWTARGRFYPRHGNRAWKDRIWDDVKEKPNGLGQKSMRSSQMYKKVDLRKRKEFWGCLERKACSTIKWSTNCHIIKRGRGGVYSPLGLSSYLRDLVGSRKWRALGA